MTEIRLSRMINPHFYPLWKTNKPYIIAKGGRGSFKSSVISMKLVTMMKHWTQFNKRVNVIAVRENASYLHDSVYNQTIWALNMLDLANEYNFYKSPLRIMHKRTGSTFYFYGGDDPMKLKSNIVDNVIAVWYEEAANFKSQDVFDQANPTFIRQKPKFVDHVTVFYSYNPPKNPYDWINEWISKQEQNPDYYIDTSTYLDDKWGFTTDQQLKLINQYKENDYDYYRWLYLGEVVGLGTNVYNMDNFQALAELPDDDYITDVFYSVDTGHEVSATTCGAYGVTKRGDVILLDTYYYSPQGKARKKPPSELSKDLKAFIDRVTEWIGKAPTRMTIDSAEGALDNQFYNDYGIHWHKVAKLKKVDMIDRVQDLLAQGRFYYLKRPENEIFIAEHRKYQWDENTLQSDDPKVIKEDDHTCDSFMYLCVDNDRFLGLKW
ncbi:PBSX family phage terminase large subunit [Limosilactobacillus fermentum]|uniref:PBSX family phage terminase large subunit n=1 Tax=Limosilactobacillus fermentum TaxID=1613 RepID=UPI002330CFBE|nr:PBSX family phage terminase large subunit [Limosilactobacillus fermentum]WCE95552.1 PBSX family phage terminase large subunit [Limosilactobacillus fermentum]